MDTSAWWAAIRRRRSRLRAEADAICATAAEAAKEGRQLAATATQAAAELAESTSIVLRQVALSRETARGQRPEAN
jgi:hypothetical protein